MHDEHEELMELKHDPVPGYRPIFFVAITVGLIYLGVVFFHTL
ncbi:MAG: hypothetical protein PVJ53_16265 [Desulfobacterales bacterium]|jgi:hypothetical protein